MAALADEGVDPTLRDVSLGAFILESYLLKLPKADSTGGNFASAISGATEALAKQSRAQNTDGTDGRKAALEQAVTRALSALQTNSLVNDHMGEVTKGILNAFREVPLGDRPISGASLIAAALGWIPKDANLATTATTFIKDYYETRPEEKDTSDLAAEVTEVTKLVVGLVNASTNVTEASAPVSSTIQSALAFGIRSSMTQPEPAPTQGIYNSVTAAGIQAITSLGLEDSNATNDLKQGVVSASISTYYSGTPSESSAERQSFASELFEAVYSIEEQASKAVTETPQEPDTSYIAVAYNNVAESDYQQNWDTISTAIGIESEPSVSKDAQVTPPMEPNSTSNETESEGAPPPSGEPSTESGVSSSDSISSSGSEPEDGRSSGEGGGTDSGAITTGGSGGSTEPKSSSEVLSTP